MLHPATRGGAIGVVRHEMGADGERATRTRSLVSTGRASIPDWRWPRSSPLLSTASAVRNAHLPDRFRRPLGRFRAWTTARSARSRLMPVACPTTAQMMLIGRTGSVSRCARAGAGAVCGRLREVLYGCRQSDHCTHPDDHATHGLAGIGRLRGHHLRRHIRGKVPSGRPASDLAAGTGVPDGAPAHDAPLGRCWSPCSRP